jgi:hypothetical protein
VKGFSKRELLVAELKEKIDSLAMQLQIDLMRLLSLTPMDQMIDALDKRMAKFRIDIENLFGD